MPQGQHLLDLLPRFHTAAPALLQTLPALLSSIPQEQISLSALPKPQGAEGQGHRGCLGMMRGITNTTFWIRSRCRAAALGSSFSCAQRILPRRSRTGINKGLQANVESGCGGSWGFFGPNSLLPVKGFCPKLWSPKLCPHPASPGMPLFR